MDTRASTTRTRLSVLPVFIAFLLNIFLVVPPTLVAPETARALAGTGFDATDGNLIVEGGETDWCTPGLGVIRKDDLPTGQTDDSYTEGAQENDTDPATEFGSIPNNKVDLARIYTASATGADGDLYVFVGWVRNDTTGTGTISFELNQSDVFMSNGVNRQRTIGDLLIEFDFKANPGSQGGYSVTLSYRTWTGTAWSSASSLAGLADGSVNEFDTIVDCLNGNQVLGVAQFGEFALNLTDLIGGQCRAFVSLFAKSRASNSINSALKDFIKPADVDFSTCGQLTILKHDENGQLLGGATFSVTPNPFTKSGTLSVTDNLAPDDDATAGVIHLSDVEPGTYSVCETAAPAGYIIDSTCVEKTIATNGSATFGPFINRLGSISWEKVDAQSGAKICCATFLVEGIAGAATGFSATVTDNGVNDGDPDPGDLLLSGLKLGTYRITETVPPSGYNLPASPSQDVVLSGLTASASSAFQDPPRADVSVSKEAVVSPIIAGQSATFTVTVTAGGTGASENVVLTDLNETAHSWTVNGADADDCNSPVAAGGTLTCDFGTIPNGESRTITITMTSDADDCELGIGNTATVSSDNDHDASNNEDSASITVLCPNPGVAKEALASPIVFGEDAVFTILVSAGGSGPAENVVLSDLNATGHEWTVGGADAGACDALSVAAGDTLTCTWALIPAGESRTITITMTSEADDCALGIANTASIVADHDVDASNNEDSASITVLCPDPSVAKSANVTPIVAGDSASFDVVVAAGNSGNSENVVLTDVNETAHVWTVSGEDAAACNLSVAPGENLVCDFGTIPNGQSRTITITMTSEADDCALGIANTASIVADADVDASNNEDGTSITVLCPDLELEKSGSEPVSAGDKVQFTLRVTNHGEGTARDVVLHDALPGTGLGTWLVVETENIDKFDCGIVADVLTCSIDELAAGAWFTVTVEARTDAAACPSITNDATVTASNEPDGGRSNDDSFTIAVNCPDVTIDKEPIESPISAGEQGRFSITVWNIGDGTAYDVEVVDTAPAGTTWIVLDDGGLFCSSEVDQGQQTLTCTLDELSPGESNARTLLIGYTTTSADCGLLDNAVAVTASNEPATSTANNSDEASIVVECPGLNMVKEADADPIEAGETASYTITVWNTGPGTAFDVLIEDTIPAGWTFDHSPCDSAASSLEEGGLESWSCTIDALEVTTYETGVKIQVSGPTTRDDCGLLTNTAFASASNSDDELERSDTITVNCPVTPSLIIEKEADADEIVISGPNDDPVADPSVVTWTLTYTLSNGPVTNAVITDELPEGLLYVADSASGGGVYDATTNTLTWTFPTLSESGSVTYETEVDPETISRVAPTVNVAVIASDQTPEDEGQDEVSVVVEPPPLGGTPTPRPSMPDTATAFGPNGEPITVPVELLLAVFLGSLGALALANARAVRSRRR